jgi:competence protein ComEC
MVSSSLPFAAVKMTSFPWWAVGIYYGLLFGGSYFVGLRTPIEQLRGKAQFLIIAAALCALLVWIPIIQAPQQVLEVFFLDVGQGDAMYLSFPNDHNMLIDAGRGHPQRIGERVITPFLNARGIDSIDVVVATHSDADHIGGMVNVLENFFVGFLIEGGSFSETKSFRDYRNTARKAGIPILIVKRDDEIKGFKPGKILVLNPSPDLLGKYDTNNDSVVLYIVYRNAAFLFTGDAEEPAEQSMISSGNEMRAMVLKAGHHGSRSGSSEEFLDVVRPEIVVFSCGKNNRYGHPHPEVLERCQQREMRWYRTDENGCITMKTNGKSLVITTER